MLFQKLQTNLSSSWETYYIAARQYYREKGNLKVPKSYLTQTGLTLGSWIQTQRRVRAGSVTGNLSEEKVRKLDEIGMRWEKADSKPRRLDLALESKRKSENLNVSANHKTGEEIGLCS